MFSRLKNTLTSMNKQDWEILSYLILIFLMAILLPVVWFWDYARSPSFELWWVQTHFFLTKLLENLWFWLLDKLERLW